MDSLHQSFQNQHFQTFIQSPGKHLSGACVHVDSCYCVLLASCFNICCDVLNGYEGTERPQIAEGGESCRYAG